MAMDAVVVLMCGLPGAGKTTLARQWIERHGSEPAIQFDDEKARRVVVERVSFDELYGSSDEQFDPVRWKAAQEEMVAVTKARVARHRSEDPGYVLLLLIDDNFHYRSMRKRFFQIADKESCGFGIVYINAPVPVCRARNAARHGAARVPGKAFSRMAELFEVPDAAFPHDYNFVTVSSEPKRETASHDDCEKAVDRVVLQAEKQWVAARAAKDVEALQRQQQLADMKLTAASISHNVDLALRRLILTALQEFDGNDKAQKAALAKHLNEKRKTLLLELKGKDLNGEMETKIIGQDLIQRFQATIVHGFPSSQVAGEQ